MKEILEGANEEIKDQQKKGEYPGMSTAASVVKIMKDGTAVIENIGDSRVYLLKKGKKSLKQLTLDDNAVYMDYSLQDQWDLQKKVANVEKFDNISDKKVKAFIENGDRYTIIQALGSETINPNIYTEKLEQGDMLIITSDGIHDNLIDKQIAKSLLKGRGNTKKIAEILVQKAKRISDQWKREKGLLQRPKRDDMTAIVVKFSGEGINHAQTSDSVAAGPQAENSLTSGDQTTHQEGPSSTKKGPLITEIAPQVVE